MISLGPRTAETVFLLHDLERKMKQRIQGEENETAGYL